MEKVNSEEEIFQDLLDKLLSKDQEEALRVSIEGYPTDYLEPGIKPLRKEGYKPLVNGNGYVGFEIMRSEDNGIALGPLYDSDADVYMINVDGLKAWYSATKIHKMLYDNDDIGSLRQVNNEEIFYVRLNKRQLLDNADKIES